VANIYVALSKFHTMVGELPETDPRTEAEVERRFPYEDFSLERHIRPRPVRGMQGDLKERVQVMQKAEEILHSLPGLDCGLCGAPTCKELARDGQLERGGAEGLRLLLQGAPAPAPEAAHRQADRI